MKLLIIEDNTTITRSLSRKLKGDYLVEIADCAETGLRKVFANDYGLIMLDLSLPDKSGLEVCKEIRRAGISTPILVLTGVDSVESRVRLLRSGADDYMAKPFHLEELKARLHALSRRRDRKISGDTILHKDLVVNTTHREVRRAGVRIKLRRKEYDVLEYLLINKGRAVSRQMIMNHVWESDKDGWNNTIDVHIKTLRDKIDRPFPDPIIKTAYGIGYMVDDGPEIK